jgi:hypothetical protein
VLEPATGGERRRAIRALSLGALLGLFLLLVGRQG